MKLIVTNAIWVVIAAVTFLQNGVAGQEATTKPVDDPEAYAVYASLLPTEWTVQVAHAKTLVFQQETGTNLKCMPAGKPLETDWKPIVDDFKAVNVGMRRLLAGFQLGSPYVVVPAAEIKVSFSAAAGDPNLGWSGFYKRWPDSGGFMTVSAVGFDTEKRRAMVYIAHSCGSLCGGGTHHFLEKVDGSWREARVAGITNCMWVS